jgi:membrane-associated protease RseP (regulator of RpoE activity)
MGVMSDVLIYTLGVVVFLIGVAASIALHEVGHMWPAKRFGVKVTQYFVGFGRTLWSVKRGETEYGLKAIPLGGYVKLVGMLPPARGTDPHELRKADTGLLSQLVSDARHAEYEHVTDADMDRLFYRKTWWQKLIVMAGGPMVNVAISAVLFTILIAGFGVEEPTTTVNAVADCAVSDAEAGRTCTDADPVTPARKIGMQPGDRIVTFNGHPVESWEQLTRSIRANGDRVATVGIDRDGQRIEQSVATTVVARASIEDPKRMQKVGFLGVEPEFATVRHGLPTVGTVMWGYTVATADVIVHLPQRMVDVAKAAVGAPRKTDGPISVVGASRVAGELVTIDDPSWRERSVRIIALLASLNLFLALFNFIPLLPLDGGHIAGALWEALRRGWAKVRGRPDPGYVDVARMLPVAYGVGALLLVMGVLLIYADIVNPVRLS